MAALSQAARHAAYREFGLRTSVRRRAEVLARCPVPGDSHFVNVIGMATSQPASFSEIAAPLFERFGTGLTLVRDGNCVRWCYADATAVVEQRSDDAVAAIFMSAPTTDAASSQDVCAVYVPRSATYTLTERGVTHMVEDVAAFFSGVREPRFTFVDARQVRRPGTA